jgi:hypothetical protein
MRKTQQQNSRKRARQMARSIMKHRPLKALWMAVIVAPLKQAKRNTRANRLARISRIRMGD